MDKNILLKAWSVFFTILVVVSVAVSVYYIYGAIGKGARGRDTPLPETSANIEELNLIAKELTEDKVFSLNEAEKDPSIYSKFLKRHFPVYNIKIGGNFVVLVIPEDNAVAIFEQITTRKLEMTILGHEKTEIFSHVTKND